MEWGIQIHPAQKNSIYTPLIIKLKIKDILKNFTKLTRKYLCRSLFFTKAAWNFIK